MTAAVKAITRLARKPPAVASLGDSKSAIALAGIVLLAIITSEAPPQTDELYLRRV